MATSQPHMPTDTVFVTSEIGGDRFIAEVVLETWTRGGRARRAGGVLWLDDKRIHDVIDAVRILGRRGGDSDRFGWTGRVFPLRELLRLGASIGPRGASLGNSTYDIEFGVQLEADDTVPVEERVSTPPRPTTEGPVMSRPPTGGLVMSRPITGNGDFPLPVTDHMSTPKKPTYGTSPGRYSASGNSDAPSQVVVGGHRHPSGTHRRAGD